MTAGRDRPFGLGSATALVVANTIGAGVFTTSGYSLADLGDRRVVMAAWVVGGAIALAGAISYGRLAACIRESGGEYVFLARVVHPAVGFVAGWVSLLAGFTGAIAFAAKAFEAYALPEGARPDWLPANALAVASILAFAALHATVLRTGLRLQNLFVALKLVLIAGLVAFALGAAGRWQGPAAAELGDGASLSVFAGSLVWISLAYSGFNAAVYVAGEVRDPARTVPRALLLGTVCIVLVYLALNAVFLYAPAPQDVAGRPDVAAAAAEALGGGAFTTAVRALICTALLTSVSSMIVAGPRVYAQMARDGVFPEVFSDRRRGEGGSPAAAIALQCGLAALVVLVSTLEDLLSYLGFTLSLSAAGTVACLFVLRAREGSSGGLVAPAIYVACTICFAALAVARHPVELAAALGTMASGLVLYAILRRR